MRMLSRLLCITVLAITTSNMTAQIALGEWRDHLSYQSAIGLAEGNGFAFCATSSAIFSYHLESGEVERFTSVNALNDVEIRSIAWNDAIGGLLVGYANGNFDIVRGSTTINMNDIKISGNIIGDKSIYEIVSQGPIAYLACGFGVVVIDLAEVEVRETWLVGPGGSQLRINDIAFYQDSIFLATNSGLLAAAQNNANLAAFTAWNKIQTVPGLPNGPFDFVETYGNDLLVNFDNSVQESDSVYRTNDLTNWNVVAALVGENNLQLRVANGFLVVPHTSNSEMLDANYDSFNSVFGYDNLVSFPRDAVRGPTGEFLIADSRFGLVRSGGGNIADLIFPNGPPSIDVRRMYSSGGVLYVATGGVTGTWDNRFDRNGLYRFQDENWGFTNGTNSALMDTGANLYAGATVDIIDVCIDPDDPNHGWASSWDEGLLEFRGEDLVQIYNHTNSALEFDAALNQNDMNNLVRVAGIEYDEEGNLWMTNSASPTPIVVRTPDNVWHAYDPGSILNNNRLMGDILCGQNGYKWIIRPRTNGLLVFNDNGTLQNTADDQYQVITTAEGQGGLPSLDVLSITEDFDGEVWVGTNRGVAVFFDPDAIFSGNEFDAQQILIEQDGNIQILLETEAISALEADGAGRKWIGTENSGVFLVSKDGTEELLHFTTENSPLPSNTINSLAIDGVSGEVFIGTDFGIFSYRGDATEGIFPSACASVFPNPVQEDYQGPITITGLTRESDVRITDAAGNLVFRTKSNGGQAIWPGVNLDGERVSSGVYVAFSVDSFGVGTCSTKILVVR